MATKSKGLEWPTAPHRTVTHLLLLLWPLTKSVDVRTVTLAHRLDATL